MLQQTTNEASLEVIRMNFQEEEEGRRGGGGGWNFSLFISPRHPSLPFSRSFGRCLSHGRREEGRKKKMERNGRDEFLWLILSSEWPEILVLRIFFFPVDVDREGGEWCGGEWTKEEGSFFSSFGNFRDGITRGEDEYCLKRKGETKEERRYLEDLLKN